MWKRLQLFHATDFQSLMYPNIIFCRLLGIFPYNINASTIEITKLWNILQTFFLAAFCIFELIIFYKIANAVKRADIVQLISAISYYIFGGFIAIITYILSSPRKRVLQTVLNASSRLSPESYRKLSRWIHVKDILGTFLILMHGISHLYYFGISDYRPFHILQMYINLLMFEMDMLYMNCVCILKLCFKAINDNLQNVVINDVRYVPKFIWDTRKNQFLLIELKFLKKYHLIISNTVQMLNGIFNLQLLATVILTFIEVSIQMYFIIFSHLTQWEDSLTFDGKPLDAFFLANVGYLVLKLILIVWACETGKNEAFKIRTTVHDVLNCTIDNQIKEELYLFSLQVLHCMQSAFTMKGFTMDTRLLAGITGNIATHILILAQFLIIMHSCDNKIVSNITQEINLKGST